METSPEGLTHQPADVLLAVPLYPVRLLLMGLVGRPQVGSFGFIRLHDVIQSLLYLLLGRPQFQVLLLQFGALAVEGATGLLPGLAQQGRLHLVGRPVPQHVDQGLHAVELAVPDLDDAGQLLFVLLDQDLPHCLQVLHLLLVEFGL